MADQDQLFCFLLLGAFLIPFIFFMVLCGFPLYYLELAIGQFSGKSPLVVWCICPLLKGMYYFTISQFLLLLVKC